MSKERVIEIVSNSGVNYGQIFNPNDLMLSQRYAHEHVVQVTQDFLIQSDPMIVGCNHALQAGTMQFNVAEGKVYFQGKQFSAAAVNLTLNAAHATHARLDYVVATLGGDVPMQTQMIPFQRIRTSEEISDGVAYPPTQFSRATEKHNIATVQVRTGTPSATPQPPVLQPTDAVLYVVTVPATATGIVSGNVNDTRNVAPNLSLIKTQVQQLQTDNVSQQEQIEDLLNYPALTQNFGSSFGRSDNLHGILLEIAEALNVQRYRYPTIVSADSKCPATAGTDGGIPVVDIPIGVVVQFGTRFVTITPEQFEDEDLNAHYATASSSFTMKPIFDGEILVPPSGEPSGTVVRFNAPDTTKGLYLKVDGGIVLRSTITPSNANECLLMKITPDGLSAPTLKRYINARNAVVHYSGTYSSASAATKQFDNDIALPTGVGYYQLYGVKSSGDTMYQLANPASYNFDSTVTVPVSVDGDKWHLTFFISSGL